MTVAILLVVVGAGIFLFTRCQFPEWRGVKPGDYAELKKQIPEHWKPLALGTLGALVLLLGLMRLVDYWS